MKTLILALLVSCSSRGLAQQLIATDAPTAKPAAEVVAETLIDGVNAGLQDRISRFKNLWETLWQNPRATPEEVLAALGTKAVKVFQAAALARTDLEAIAQVAGTDAATLVGDAKYLAPAKAVTVHADGTVTVNE